MAAKCLSRALNVGRRKLCNDNYSKLTLARDRIVLSSAFDFKQFSTEVVFDSGPATISLKEVSNLPTTTSPQLNTFNSRTHTCGELRLADEGATVRICGWLQFKRLDKFLVVKDSYGVTQLLLEDAVIDDGVSVSHIPLESVVAAEGVVIARPSKMRNPKMSTGDVEVVVHRLRVLNPCRESLPFFSTSTLKHGESNERMRLTNRYLDLRMDRMQVGNVNLMWIYDIRVFGWFACLSVLLLIGVSNFSPQANLRFRSSILMRMREFLHDLHGFVDVETPTLFRRTPGEFHSFLETSL